MTIFLYSLLAIIGIISIVFCIKLIQLASGNKRVSRELKSLHYDKLFNVGSVKSLSILPLIDFYTDDDRLKTEAGISYLIKADDTTILIDTGLNLKREHPSPLLHNMNALGVSPEDIDLMFITHRHMDHLGGMREQKSGSFSISRGNVSLRKIPVYSPVDIAPSHWNQGPENEVITEPKILKNGIASIGVIPRNLFLMGYTPENCLAINVKGKGIVLIIGCGHQTIERIIERAKILFDAPIYGIIGGLHYPVKNGRIMIGPLNIQNIVGNDRAPWDSIKEQDVTSAINAINDVNPKVIALSPHDSSDWSITQFKNAFKDKYQTLKAGKQLKI